MNFEVCSQHIELPAENKARSGDEIRFVEEDPGLPSLGPCYVNKRAALAIPVVTVALAYSAPFLPIIPCCRGQVEIAQHGRPVTLDLDCSDKARYPLLALPRSHTPITSASRAEVNEQSDSNMASDVGCLAAMIDHRGDAVGEVRVESESDKEKKEEKEGEDEEGRIEMGGTLENGRSRRSSAANPSSSSSRARENGVGTADNHRHMPTSGVTSGASREPSKSRHHQALSPARLVAVLVDGSGRGWMAAHRLWSVQDVGTDALMGAGLALEDVDQDQEVSGSSCL